MSAGIPGCFGCATPFQGLQIWASHQLHGHFAVTRFMTSPYGWPFCETLHFLGLSLLIGTVGMFDLRVLGMAKRLPVGPLQRLLPWGIAGFAVNVLTGLMFLMTYPDQYLYQWPFIWKIGCMLLAGTNALVFTLAIKRKVQGLGPGEDAPLAAKMMCAMSLCLWVAVIVAGRLLAFYKPVFTMPPP